MVLHICMHLSIIFHFPSKSTIQSNHLPVKGQKNNDMARNIVLYKSNKRNPAAHTTKVNFLDVALGLRSEKYYPLYVHKESNHAPCILKNIPKSINKRLSDISTDKECFDNVKGISQEALEKSGYCYNLSFNLSQAPPTADY